MLVNHASFPACGPHKDNTSWNIITTINFRLDPDEYLSHHGKPQLQWMLCQPWNKICLGSSHEIVYWGCPLFFSFLKPQFLYLLLRSRLWWHWWHASSFHHSLNTPLFKLSRSPNPITFTVYLTKFLRTSESVGSPAWWLQSVSCMNMPSNMTVYLHHKFIVHLTLMKTFLHT